MTDHYYMRVIASKNEFIEYAQSIGLKILRIDEDTVEMEIEPAPLRAPPPRSIEPKFQQLAGSEIQKSQTVQPDTCDLILMNSGDRKIGVIKVIRAITGFGLVESKYMVDNYPQTVCSGILRNVAERYARELTEAGATVRLS